MSTEIFYASRGLFLLVIATVFFIKKYPNDVVWSFLSWLIIPLMTMAPFIATMPLPVDPKLAVVFAAIVGGVGIVWSYLPYILVYSKLDALKIAGYVLLSFALASVVRFPISILPFELAIIVVCPLPFLGVYIAKKAMDYTAAQSAVSPQPGKMTAKMTPGKMRSLKNLVPIAVELALYGIAVGMIRLSKEGLQYETTAYLLHLIFRIVFPLGLFWWIYTKHGTLSISRMFQIALLFVITGLVVSSFFGIESSPFATAATTCARTAIIILLWLILALLAHRSKYHPYIVFGVGWALYMLAIVAGMMLAEIIGAETLLTDSLMLNIMYFLVVSTICILVFRKDGTARLLPADSEYYSPSIEPASIEARCQAIGEQHRLTKREVEVMQYICKGRSKGYIAEEFSISENTVRGYAKNLYSKLNIHSRQDLLNLIDNISLKQ